MIGGADSAGSGVDIDELGDEQATDTARALREAMQHASPADQVPLDAIDLALLRLLSVDARLSQRKLAREVGMSAPAVADRIMRMERLGVIRGYRADIDRAALGYPLVVYVGLVTVQGAHQPRVLAALRAMPEVEDAQVVTGPKDMLVRLRVRDHQHLRDVLFDAIWNVPGINRTECFISLGGMETKQFDLELLDAITDGEGTRVARHRTEET